MSTAMALSQDEASDLFNIITHCLFGLAREDLIDQNFAFGPKEHLVANGVTDPDEGGGLFVGPSVLGAEMFIRAHGATGVNPYALLFAEPKLTPLSEVVIPPGSRTPKPLSSTPA
jgi:hypothetical protein